MRHRLPLALLAAAALAWTAPAAAQQTPPPATLPAAQTTPQAGEIAQIQQRLGQIQQRALQDSTVRAEQQAFDGLFRAAMIRLDPAAATWIARAEALQGEVEAARTAGDNARLNALATEAQQLQAFFGGLQERVMADPAVAAARGRVVEKIMAAMQRLDPQTQTLVARLQELRGAPQQP